MISTKKKRILRSALALVLTAVTIASVNTSVYSAPSAEELEDTTSGLQGELDDLNSQLSSLSAELDSASSKIEDLSADVEKAKLDLAAAQLNEDAQYDAMKDRIKFMYEGGSASLIQILFSSQNMADFLNKAEYVTTISEYDRSMLDELRDVRISVEEKQSDLVSKQQELVSLQENLEAKKNELNSKISSTSGQLDDYKSQLERAKAAEEASKVAQNNDISGSVTPPANNGNSNNSSNSNSNSGQINANTSDVALFAALLECESGSYDGMLAVATVIMNRVASPSYPNSIREVIYQPGQFGPTWNGSLNRVLARGPSSTAYSVAQAALGGARHSAVINCYSFNGAAWTDVPGVVIGGNVFY